MKKKFWLILLSISAFSCRKLQFIDQMEGKWNVTEVTYVYEDTTLNQPTNNFWFEFNDYSYWSYMNDSLIESGSFSVNNQVTEITFHTFNGNSKMKILEKSDNYQHWRSKIKLIDFYLEFKLQRIQ